MCFVIAIIALVLSIQFLLQALYWYALASGVTALIFIGLMIQNIYQVKKRRSKQDHTRDS